MRQPKETIQRKKARSKGKKKKEITLDTKQRRVMIHPEGKNEKEKRREKVFLFSALRKHAPRPSGVAHEPFREKIT